MDHIDDIDGNELREGDHVTVLRNGGFRGYIACVQPFAVTIETRTGPVDCLSLGPNDVRLQEPQYPLYPLGRAYTQDDLLPLDDRTTISRPRRHDDGSTTIPVWTPGAGRSHLLLTAAERDRLIADLTELRDRTQATRASEWLAERAAQVQR